MALRETLLNNAGWKALAVVLASMVWFTIRSSIHAPESIRGGAMQQGRTREFQDLPITVLASALDAGGFRVSPPVVKVVLGGPEEVLQRVRPADIVAHVNLIDIREARAVRKRIIVTPPTGTTVIGLTPQDVVIDRSEAGDR
jgi:hypothetical protein